MDQFYLIRLNRRRVRSNVEAESLTIRLDDVERELTLRLGQSLPRLAHMISLLLRGQLGGETSDYGCGLERVRGLHEGCENIASRHHQQRDVLAEALCY